MKLPQSYRVTLGDPLLLRPATLIGDSNTDTEARTLVNAHVKLTGEKSRLWYDACQGQEAYEIIGREAPLFPRYLVTSCHD